MGRLPRLNKQSLKELLQTSAIVRRAAERGAGSRPERVVLLEVTHPVGEVTLRARARERAKRERGNHLAKVVLLVPGTLLEGIHDRLVEPLAEKELAREKGKSLTQRGLLPLSVAKSSGTEHATINVV